MARAAQVSIAMGLASFPMCFDLYTCLWFNELAVTTDVLPAEVRPASAAATLRFLCRSVARMDPLRRAFVVQELETYFEVGMWSWGWMEPPCAPAPTTASKLQAAGPAEACIRAVF